jgi:predicted nucleotide-binding protein
VAADGHGMRRLTQRWTCSAGATRDKAFNVQVIAAGWKNREDTVIYGHPARHLYKAGAVPRVSGWHPDSYPHVPPPSSQRETGQTLKVSTQPTVFLVHGRDTEARDAITEFLEAMGVKVVTWADALSALDLSDRDIWRIVGKGFALSDAVIVLSTPDEVGLLRSELWRRHDSPTARGPRFQPRQNVLLELGYALFKGESSTIHVTVGDVAPPTDRDGKWTARIPTMAPDEFRTHIGEMLRRIFSSAPFDSGKFDDFINGMLAREAEWNVPGKIEEIYARETKRVLPSFIEAGVSVRTTRFRYSDFFATGREFILTGTNFGDAMGDRGTPPELLHNLIVQVLKTRRDSLVFVVIAPHELLAQLHYTAIRDLKDRSAARLQMLQHDPRLTRDERARLRIFDHPGAMFLSAAIRDPDFTSSEDGLAVVTPRWFKDEISHQRMFFAVEQRVNPEIFKAITGQIYPSIKVDQGLLTGTARDGMGGRSIDEICRTLGVKQDPFRKQLSSFPVVSVP